MIERPRFSTTRMREGYEVGRVDDTVDRVMVALESEPPGISVAEIERLRFTPVRLGAGYDMGEVDDWLDQVVAELHRRGVGGEPVAAPSPPSPAETPVAPEPATPAPAAIEEVGRSVDVRVTALAMIVVVVVVLLLAYAL